MLQQSNLLSNEDKKKIFGEEKVIISYEVKKYNDYGVRQDRILVVTDNAIYNMKKRRVKRRILLQDVRGITKSDVG